MRKICHKTGRSYKGKELRHIFAYINSKQYQFNRNQNYLLRDWLFSNYGALI